MVVSAPHIACKRDQIKIRDYTDRRVTSPIPLMSRYACNGDNGENRQRAGEFMVIVFVCLVPVCILLTSMHGFVPCE